MAFNGAINALKHAEMPSDNTTSTITQLPANILEAFIPGYSIISKFLLDAIGFDITLVVSLCFLVFGLATSIRFTWRHAYEQFERYLTSSIRIESDDDIYDHLMEWVAGHRVSKKSLRLIAKTGRQNAWDLTDESVEDGEEEEAVEPGTLINFRNWDAKVPPRFQPSFGSHRFFHRGMLFEFNRGQKQLLNSGWGGSMIRDEEDLTLRCVGRSTQPIKDLIREARDHYLDKGKSCTVVRRPTAKEYRGRGRGLWVKVATRPSRPMHTVVLDHEQKHRVLADINEYLDPATPRWYACRGVPYRRGYLFEGPPGTGKSSLAWAIAGVFGIDIYCISLVDPSLTEEDLGMMFTSLPRRCVVLLEDIDSAGLSKRQEVEVKNTSSENSESSKIGAEITKAFESVQKNSEKNNDKKGITLSGLLNAIDGVASHEGRVLVMTTNFPDKLDEALIRPGRIDMRVAFTNATRLQICELFTRMYSPDLPATTSQNQIKFGPGITATKENEARSTLDRSAPAFEPRGVAATLTPPDSPDQSNTPTASTPTDIESIAEQFASCLPEGTFTPAEIQGFLLTRKKEPKRALDEVAAWRDMVIEAKEKRANVEAM